MNDTITLTDQAKVRSFYMAKAGRTPSIAEARYMVEEEAVELLNAIANGDPDAHVLKEACDVYYTILGLAVASGWNFGGAFEAVHESNMTKDVTPVGKVRKGDSYVEPDMEPYL